MKIYQTINLLVFILLLPRLVFALGCTDNYLYPNTCTIIHVSVNTVGQATDFYSKVFESVDCGRITVNTKGSNNSINRPATRYYFNIYRWTGTNWTIQSQNYWYVQDVDQASAFAMLGDKYYLDTYANNPNVVYPDGLPNCGGPSCNTKTGEKNYKLEVHDSGSPPSTDTLSCYEDCETTPKSLWTDCIDDSCVTSMEYTFTGQICNGQSSIDGVGPTPPERCTTQLEQKIAECGGSLNVQYFDFENCTGTCVPDPCHDKWLALVDKCGGIMAVSNWNSETCEGICASDPLANTDILQLPRPPDEIATTTKKNPDGSKEVTQTVTNNITDGSTQTITTTTYYDSNNVQIGESTTTTSTRSGGGGDSSDEEGEEPNYPVPDSWYEPTYNISDGLINAINYQDVLNAVGSFQDTIVFQIPNLLIDTLKLVSGSSCSYPPAISIDLFGKFSSKNVSIDLSQVDTIVDIMKFFFAILIVIGTCRLVMQIFE